MSGSHTHSHMMLNQRAALASVAMAFALLFLKVWGYFHTYSIALLGSLGDTALDFLTSLIILSGVRFAAEPADHNHRFGHGKAEALAALVQVIIITLSALAIAKAALDSLLSHENSIQSPEIGLGVSAIAMMMTLALVIYQRFVIARTGSLAISTDNLHYTADLLINFAVIVAILLQHYLGWGRADSFFGLGIAFWLIWGAYQSSRSALHDLMDTEWPEEERHFLMSLVNKNPHVLGLHDLRTRSSGVRKFAQFHICVNGDMSVRAAHDVVDEVERSIMQAMEHTEVLIHVDPEGHMD
jgi:ferrous-iron efflux pump FieF